MKDDLFFFWCVFSCLFFIILPLLSLLRGEDPSFLDQDAGLHHNTTSTTALSEGSTKRTEKPVERREI